MEGICTGFGVEATGDFLLDLELSDSTFRTVVAWWNCGIVKEVEDVVTAFDYSPFWTCVYCCCRSLLILLQTLTQLAVFFQQSVNITIQRTYLVMLGIHRFSQRLKLGQKPCKCLGYVVNLLFCRNKDSDFIWHVQIESLLFSYKSTGYFNSGKRNSHYWLFAE